MAKSAAVKQYTRNRRGRPEPAQPEAQADPNEQLRQAVESFIATLDRQANEQVGKKVEIEDRWFEDIRRYFGRYDGKTEANLKNENKSRVFVSWTRNKTHQWESRLCDMLFPSDDKNWGIQPTPVPQLVANAQNAAFQARSLTDQANLEVKLAGAHNDNAVKAQGMQRARDLANQAQPHAENAMRFQAVMDEAKKRADAMMAEIDDQFTQANYNFKCRESIHDACLMGTGIIKGPLTAVPEKMRRPWVQRLDPATNKPSNVYQLGPLQENGVEWRRTDPWNFFPDMNARHPSEWEFTYERHLMTDKEIRKLGRTPGFDPDVCRELLISGSKTPLPNYVNELRNITGQQSAGNDPRFVVWEYHGPITADDFMRLAMKSGDQELYSALQQKQAVDPLDEYQAIVWFSNGRLLKFGPHPLESGESLYSLFNFQRDESSVFGFGISYLMQNSQAALNGAWRMILDNGTFAAGPQIIVDRKQVSPANKNWNVRGPKLWYKNENLEATRGPPIEIVQIENHQDRLQAIVDMAIKFADEEASMPLIAQGDQASHITQTAQGMSMLMNSANVTFRHVVRNFDDNMTCPNVRRAYDYNMQNSLKDYIKGDYQVDARGSSVLMERQMQSQNLAAILKDALSSPILLNMTKVAALYRKLIQANMLSADEIVDTDDEIAAAQAKQASQPPQPDPNVLKLQLQKEIAEMETQTQLQIAQMQRDTAMITLAEQKNMNLDKLKALFATTITNVQHKERMAAVDAAVSNRRDAAAAKAGAKVLPHTDMPTA